MISHNIATATRLQNSMIQRLWKFPKRSQKYLSTRSLDIRSILQERISTAIDISFGPEIRNISKIHVSAISNDEFGHYQCTCAMPLAKVLKMKPYDVAGQIFKNLETKDMIESTEVAGPGFMNIRSASPLI